MGKEDEVTDSFRRPPRPASAGVQATVQSPLGDRPGTLVSVTGDEVAILVQEGLPVDTQVQIRAASASVDSVGQVIWSRADENQAGVVLGIEIIGGAADWQALLP